MEARAAKDGGKEDMPSSPVLLAAFNRMLEEKVPPPLSLVPQLSAYIHHQKVQALFDSNYSYAEKLDELILMLNESFHNSMLTTCEDGTSSRKEQFRRKLGQSQEKLVNRLESFDLDTKIQLRDTKDSQMEEIERFKRQWNDPKHIQLFNKPSNELLDLRYIEKNFAIQKMYAEAKKTKADADALQAKEENAMQAMMAEKMRVELNALREKQSEDLEKFTRHRNELRQEVVTEAQKKIDIMKKTIDKLSQIEGSPKIQVKRSSALMKSDVTESIRPAEMSARTKEKLSSYRAGKMTELKVPLPSFTRMREITSMDASRRNMNSRMKISGNARQDV